MNDFERISTAMLDVSNKEFENLNDTLKQRAGLLSDDPNMIPQIHIGSMVHIIEFASTIIFGTMTAADAPNMIVNELERHLLDRIQKVRIMAADEFDKHNANQSEQQHQTP